MRCGLLRRLPLAAAGFADFDPMLVKQLDMLAQGRMPDARLSSWLRPRCAIRATWICCTIWLCCSHTQETGSADLAQRPASEATPV